MMSDARGGLWRQEGGAISWLSDVLLESPVPPSNWLPGRPERLADARDTLRRYFGEERGTSGRPSYRLCDLGSAHPLFSGTRIVSRGEVEADLEADITSVNPPILQGWAVGLLFLVFGAVVVGLGSLGRTDPLGPVAAMLLGAPLAWILAVAIVGLGQWTIELRRDGVRVRRWFDVWLGRAGWRLGPPERIRATLSGPFRLVIETETGSIGCGLRAWPPSARADLVDELPIWGVEANFGRHRHHHEGRTRHRPRPEAGR